MTCSAVPGSPTSSVEGLTRERQCAAYSSSSAASAPQDESGGSPLGTSLGLGRWFLLGIAAAAAQAVWHYMLIRDRTREGCFRAFRLNHWVGLAVFAGVVVDLALR